MPYREKADFEMDFDDCPVDMVGEAKRLAKQMKITDTCVDIDYSQPFAKWRAQARHECTNYMGLLPALPICTWQEDRDGTCLFVE